MKKILLVILILSAGVISCRQEKILPPEDSAPIGVRVDAEYIDGTIKSSDIKFTN